MARSVSTIYQASLAAKNAQANLSNLNSQSQVSKWNLMLWINAVGQAIAEQLGDLLVSNIESQIANAPVFTLQWIAQMCKLFQYSVSNPQVIQAIISPVYPYVSLAYDVVNSALRPINQSACISNTNGQLIIKVANNNAPISNTILVALQSFLTAILPPNDRYIIISDNADQLLINATVYYNAAYSGVIQASMDAAISAYLMNIPFNGIFTVSGLEEAMLAVPGVGDYINGDVVLNQISWRKATDAVPPAPSNNLVLNNTLISRNYQTYAGYVIVEQTAGYTPDDLITYTPS